MTAARHAQFNKRRAQTIPRESQKIVCAFTYYVILFLFTCMWTCAAPTSQNPSARRVGKTNALLNTFGNAESRRKRAQKTGFLFKKVRAPFRGH